MKRITKTAVLILSALMLFGCADSSVDAKPPVTVASPSSTSEALPEKPASSITDISSEGGNPGNPECFTLNITISEEKYFVDNHEITFEELKKDIDSLKEGSTVKIEDENSTLKAFNAVKNYLTEKEIPFNLD